MPTCTHATGKIFIRQILPIENNRQRQFRVSYRHVNEERMVEKMSYAIFAGGQFNGYKI